MGRKWQKSADLKLLQAKLKQFDSDVNSGLVVPDQRVKPYNPNRLRKEVNKKPKDGFNQGVGLKNAYASPSGLFQKGRTLYVCGTRPNVGDVEDDIKLVLPAFMGGGVRQTTKYKQVKAYLAAHPEVKMVVGHSLGAAVCDAITQDMPQMIEMAYGDPYPQFVMGKGHHRVDGDPIALADVTADTRFPSSLDPHDYWSVASTYGNEDYDDQL